MSAARTIRQADISRRRPALDPEESAAPSSMPAFYPAAAMR